MGRNREQIINKIGGYVMKEIKLNALINTLEHSIKERSFYDKQDIKEIIKILKEIRE